MLFLPANEALRLSTHTRASCLRRDVPMSPSRSLAVLSAALLVRWAGGSLNVQPVLRGQVVVEPAFTRPRRSESCSSEEGPFCAPLAGGGAWPAWESSDGGDALWQLLAAGVDVGLQAEDPSLEGLEEGKGGPDEGREEGSSLAGLPAVAACHLGRSGALDLTALPPWLGRAPQGFAAGLPAGVGLTWVGDWEAFAAPGRRSRARTVLRLTGIGSIAFSQPILVSELPIEGSGGAALVVGYLGGKAVWRVRVGEAWQNGARGLWAVDEISFMPVGSVLFGGMTIAVGRGDCLNRKLVSTVVMDHIGAMRLTHTSISPLAPVMTLQQVWQQGLVVARPHHWDVPRTWDQLPSLDEIKQVFEALEGGMRPPEGVAWPQIEAEAERFHEALSSAAAAELHDQRRWWQQFWSSNRFDVLEACFLAWLDAPRPAKSSDAEAPKSRVDHFLEQLVGGSASKALRGVMARMSPQGDATFADALEEALGELMATMEGTAEEEQQREAEDPEKEPEKEPKKEPAKGPEKEPEGAGAPLAPGESRVELGVELDLEPAEPGSGLARPSSAAAALGAPEEPAHEAGAEDTGALLQDLLGELRDLEEARRQRQLQLEAALKELLEHDGASGTEAHIAVTPGDATHSAAATTATTAAVDPAALVITTAAATSTEELATEAAELMPADSIAAAVEVAQDMEADARGMVQAQSNSRLWWRLSGLAAAALLLLLWTILVPRDSQTHWPAESFWA